MVYSEIMAEASSRTPSAKFVGIVSELVPADSDTSSSIEDAYFVAIPKALAPVTSNVPEPAMMESIILEPILSTSTTSKVHVEPIATRPGDLQPETTEAKNVVEKQISGKNAIECRIPIHPTSTTIEHSTIDTIIIPFHPRVRRTNPSAANAWRWWYRFRMWLLPPPLFTGFLINLLPLAIIGAISRFNPGASSPQQRGIVIAWLAWSVVFPLIARTILAVLFVLVIDLPTPSSIDFMTRSLVVLFLLSAAVPLALFVNVGKEMMQYGNCIIVPQ
jgi:hypothetical protein